MKIPGTRRSIFSSTLLALASICVSIFLAVHTMALDAANARLNSRIGALEASMQRRDAVDPLRPIECDVTNGPGDAREHPCNISIWRLLAAPQQFDGKWVAVEGRYRGGFEQSALYDVDLLYELPPELMVVFMQPRFALWVDADQLQALERSPTRVRLVGVFRRGPSGHLRQYGGQLTDATLVAGSMANRFEESGQPRNFSKPQAPRAH